MEKFPNLVSKVSDPPRRATAGRTISQLAICTTRPTPTDLQPTTPTLKAQGQTPTSGSQSPLCGDPMERLDRVATAQDPVPGYKDPPMENCPSDFQAHHNQKGEATVCLAAVLQGLFEGEGLWEQPYQSE
jgi:hypothetical protein